MSEKLLLAYCVLPAMLCFVLAVVARTLGRRRAALRHRILALGVAAAVAVPALTAIAPRPIQWRMPVEVGGPQLRVPARLANERAGASGPAADPGGAALGTASEGRPARWTDLRSAKGSLAGVGPIPWLLVIAGLGSILMAWRQLAASMALRRLLAGAGTSPSASTETLLLAQQLGIERRLSVIVSDEIAVPMTWGCWRPRIALPSGFEEWPTQRRRLALLHELAHVRRGDALALAVFRAAEILYWWNPLLWWLSELARGDAEVASDLLVLESGVRPITYAHELLSTLRSARTRAVALPAAFWTGNLALAERVKEICRPNRAPGLPARGAAFSAGIVTLILVGGLATARPLPPIEGSGMEADSAIAADREWLIEDEHLPRAPAADLRSAVRARLTDPNPMVRRSALNAFRDLGLVGLEAAAIRRLLQDPDREVRSAASVVLGLEPARPGAELQWEPRHRRGARPGEFALLQRSFASADPREREAAVAALRDLRHPQATGLLIGALGDESKHVRQAAAGALGDVGADEAVPALAAALGDPSDHVRQTAAGSLGQLGIGATAALPALIEAASDQDEHVRQAAVDSLGELGEEAAESAILTALEDPNPFVRQSALNSLVELRRHAMSIKWRE